MTETVIRNDADRLLREIGELQAQLGRVNAAAEQEMAAVRARYAGEIKLAASRIAAAERRLTKLARGQKTALMGEADRVDLPHGAVLFAIERRVKRIKGMLPRLRRRGLNFCIKVAESVNWAGVEELTDDTLAELGTAWVEKERFSYEIREA